MICTRCHRIDISRIVFSYEVNQYKLIWCNQCCIEIIPQLIGHIEGSDLRFFLQNNGIKLQTKERKSNMPKAFKKMEKAMQKEYGKKKGTKTASMTWNKKMAGTGKTVGRGRK
jgi:hypothetical protein